MFDQLCYRPRYYLYHPIVFYKDVRRTIKFAYQRLTRDWDDSVTWNIDYWLCKIMPDILEKLKKDKQGIPNEVFDNPNKTHEDEEWKKAEAKYDAILDEMIEGFKAAGRIINREQPIWDELHKKFEERYSGEEAFSFKSAEKEGFSECVFHPGYKEIKKEMDFWNIQKRQYNEDMKKFHRGMILFHRWFFSLWD